VLSVGLALAAAALYGLSDFFGGVVSRRASVWGVAFASQVGALLIISAAAAWLVAGRATPADFAWGALAGIGTGLGTAFLYRGLAEGRMGVVAPISAVGTALVPVAVGVLTGDRPPLLTWVGIACAVPAIWLVSSEPSVDGVAGARSRSGVLDGILAGLAFGLMFAALGQVPDTAGLAPLVGAELVSIAAVAALATLMGRSWIPREAAAGWGLAVGGLSAVAAVLFLFSTQAGMLTVAAVLSSLYPVFTVLLAATILRERIHGVQAIGLGLAGVAVVLVALG
jgi:drug/metabolite transporter (DMT)-like permease